MSQTSKYTIDYQSLALGEHELTFHIDDDLFVAIPESEITNANINATAQLIKHHNFAELSITLKGTVTTICDRCLDPVEIPIECETQCIIKVTDNQTDNDDPDIIYISPNENNVNLQQILYESVILNLPVQRVHQTTEQCNPEILKFISQQE